MLSIETIANQPIGTSVNSFKGGKPSKKVLGMVKFQEQKTPTGLFTKVRDWFLKLMTNKMISPIKGRTTESRTPFLDHLQDLLSQARALKGPAKEIRDMYMNIERMKNNYLAQIKKNK